MQSARDGRPLLPLVASHQRDAKKTYDCNKPPDLHIKPLGINATMLPAALHPADTLGCQAGLHPKATSGSAP